MLPTFLQIQGQRYIRADSVLQPIIKIIPQPAHIEAYLPSHFDRYLSPNAGGVEMSLSYLKSIVEKLVNNLGSGEVAHSDVPIMIRLHLMLQQAPPDFDLVTVIYTDMKDTKHGKWRSAFVREHEAGHVRFDRFIDLFELKVTKDISHVEEQRRKGVMAFMPMEKIPWKPLPRQIFHILRQEIPSTATWDDVAMMMLVKDRIVKATGSKSKDVSLLDFPVTENRLLLAYVFSKLFGDDVVDDYTEAVGKRGLRSSNKYIPHEIFADLGGCEFVINKLNCPKYVAFGNTYSARSISRVFKTGMNTKKLWHFLHQPKTYATIMANVLGQLK